MVRLNDSLSREIDHVITIVLNLRLAPERGVIAAQDVIHRDKITRIMGDMVRHRPTNRAIAPSKSLLGNRVIKSTYCPRHANLRRMLASGRPKHQSHLVLSLEVGQGPACTPRVEMPRNIIFAADHCLSRSNECTLEASPGHKCADHKIYSSIFDPSLKANPCEFRHRHRQHGPNAPVRPVYKHEYLRYRLLCAAASETNAQWPNKASASTSVCEKDHNECNWDFPANSAKRLGRQRFNIRRLPGRQPSRRERHQTGRFHNDANLALRSSRRPKIILLARVVRIRALCQRPDEAPQQIPCSPRVQSTAAATES